LVDFEAEAEAKEVEVLPEVDPPPGVPKPEGVEVGVYLTSPVFVQLVNLAVALPVIAPSVASPVPVK
jgi:hypothetical protein